MSAVLPSPPGASTLPSIQADELSRARDALFVDLRSPSEFAEDHVPGAHCRPLFDDVQRALIGTLYRQVSPGAAFEEARHIVRGRIVELVRGVAELAAWSIPAADLEARVLAMTSGGIERLSNELVCAPAESLPERPIVFNCWRGGLRSRSVVAFLRALGFDRAIVLAGGYKAYRAGVVAGLEALELPPVFVLRGLTGVGKTIVLREIESLRPGWTLDLEACAGHRSSLLGMVGLAPVSQKRFESRIVTRLRAGLKDVLVLEGESRKVGDATLPPRLWCALSGGTNFELAAPIERRIEVLKEDYASSPERLRELAQRLPIVQVRMPRRSSAVNLVALLERGEVDALARLLLTDYYDPLYKQSDAGQVYAASIDASDPVLAAREIVQRIEDALVERRARRDAEDQLQPAASARVTGSAARGPSLPSSGP
jgi:tRNA 2-selenouridine synthase